MTGREVLNAALALMQETDAAPYEAVAAALINTVLAETFETANRRRGAAGQARMTAVPQIRSLEEEMPYDQTLVAAAFPKGLAARLFSEERDNAMLGMYKEEYRIAVHGCERGICRFAAAEGSGVQWEN